MVETTLPRRLLGLLADGGIRTVGDLARGLDTSEALTRLMLDDLTRLGYLAALGGGSCADASCAGCSLAGGCHLPQATGVLPLLALTPKGRQYARKRAPGRAD